MLRELDGQLTELSFIIAAQRVPGANDLAIGALEDKAGQLLALRERVGSVRSPAQLAALQIQLTEIVRTATDAAQAVQVGAAAAGNLTVARAMAQATYDANMTRVEERIEQLREADVARFNEIEKLADASGVDLDRFTDQRAALEEEAEQLRKQGDRFGALQADTLNVWNTAFAAQAVVDGSTDPDLKAKAQVQADQALLAAQQAEAALRDAAHAQAALKASELTFANEDEKQRWIETNVAGRMAAFNERKATLAETTGVAELQIISADVAQLNTSIISATYEQSTSSQALADTQNQALSEAALMSALSADADPKASGRKLPLSPTADQAAKAAALPVAQDTRTADIDEVATQSLPKSDVTGKASVVI